MTDHPTKPIATSADGADMEQASTDEGKGGPAVDQKAAKQEIAAEEEAAQLGDFA